MDAADLRELTGLRVERGDGKTSVAWRLERVNSVGLILRPRFRRRRVALAYGEVLTVERPATPFGLVLHTRTTNPMRVSCSGERRLQIESELRRRGVRVVDEYGAMITPTVEDFEAELARAPMRLRQSSDDA